MFLLALSMPFWSLGHPLIEVDDARYAEVPREMMVLKHWATPTLDYFDYVEKPPMGYWLDIASYKVFGVNEAAARLPTDLLSVLGIILLIWTGTWLFDFETGLLSGIFLSTSLLYFFLSHYITPDLPLTVFLLGSFSLILRTLLNPQDASWAVPGAWAFSALAFLSKGLIGLVFPGGWAILSALAIPALRKNFSLLFKPRGILLFTALLFPWFWTMEKHHPGFFKFFFWDQHVLRFLTPKYHRSNPWYFFILIFPLAVLPWSPLALSGLWKGISEIKKGLSETSLAIWVLMIIAFFSISHSKLITYILPVIPQACLLAAREFKKPLARWAKNTTLGISGIFILASIGVLILIHTHFKTKLIPQGLPDLNLNVGCAVAVLLLFTAALWSFIFEKQPPSQTIGPKIHSRLWKPFLCAYLAGFLGLYAFQFDSSFLSAKNIGGFINQFIKPGDLIYTDGIYLHGIPFYTQHPVDKVLNWTGELAYAKNLKKNQDRFGDDAAIKELPIAGKQVFIVLQKRDIVPVLKMIQAKKMSGNRIYLSGPWACLDIY